MAVLSDERGCPNSTSRLSLSSLSMCHVVDVLGSWGLQVRPLMVSTVQSTKAFFGGGGNKKIYTVVLSLHGIPATFMVAWYSY